MSAISNNAHRALAPLVADAKRSLHPDFEGSHLSQAVRALIPAINAAITEHGTAMEEAQRMGERLNAVYQRFDLSDHLGRQREWSLATFGPGDRRKGIVDHLRKELQEIENNPKDIFEWIDVILLGLDGAWRAGHTPEQIVEALAAKQTKNEGRVWPDWRTQSADKAIEHDRSADPQGLPDIEPPAAQVEESETELLVFQGYSDDTFGEYGRRNVDFCDNGSGTAIEWLITSPDGEQLLVVGQYGKGAATGWVVGVAPWDPDGDDETMPDWPISIEQSERAYSPALFVSAPKGSTLRCLQETEDDDQG